MTAPNSVELLHSEYAQLHRQHPATLTPEQRRSLAFFTAELAAPGAAVMTGDVPRDVADWLRSLSALESFVRREGRQPRENRRLPAAVISTEEKHCVNLVRAQRRAYAAGRLCSYQERRLLCIPGFTFHPLEDAWQANRDAYARFTTAQGDAPKLRSSNGEERALARWAAKTRLAYRVGRLAQSRIDSVNGIDFWAWGAPHRRD